MDAEEYAPGGFIHQLDPVGQVRYLFLPQGLRIRRVYGLLPFPGHDGHLAYKGKQQLCFLRNGQIDIAFRYAGCGHG